MAESVAYRLIIVASQSASWFIGQCLRVRYNVIADGPPELFAPRHNHCLILAPTHRSYLDPWLLMIGLPYRHFRSLVPVRTLATQDLRGALRWFVPLIKILYWLGGVIELPPEEESDRSLPEKLRGLLVALKHGDVVMIFPEGKINREPDPPVAEFAPGVVFIHRKLGSPIVPVATWLSLQRWPRRRYTVHFARPAHIPDNLDQEHGAAWLRQQVLALYEGIQSR